MGSTHYIDEARVGKPGGAKAPLETFLVSSTSKKHSSCIYFTDIFQPLDLWGIPVGGDFGALLCTPLAENVQDTIAKIGRLSPESMHDTWRIHFLQVRLSRGRGFDGMSQIVQEAPKQISQQHVDMSERAVS